MVAMMKPNSTGFSNPMKTSSNTSTCQALLQYCRASRLRNSLATMRPPASPTRSEMMLRKNSMNTVAVTRGVTSFFMGSGPSAQRACWPRAQLRPHGSGNQLADKSNRAETLQRIRGLQRQHAARKEPGQHHDGQRTYAD